MVNKLLSLIHIHDIPVSSLGLEGDFHPSTPQLEVNAGVILHSPVLLTQYCAGDKIEKNEMGWACGSYGGGEGGV